MIPAVPTTDYPLFGRLGCPRLFTTVLGPATPFGFDVYHVTGFTIGWFVPGFYVCSLRSYDLQTL